MEKGIETIIKMLELAHTDATVFPSTIIYNEGWMLRIVLSLQSEGIECLPFTFLPRAKWFSEALISGPFLPRFRGDSQGEGFTHLDGAIGHFDIRLGTKTGLALRDDSTQFVAIEAKIFSHLTKGTINAPDYDQAARIVACIAWEIYQSKRALNDFDSLGFYLIAPREQINRGIFSSQVNKHNIGEKVESRIDAYSEFYEAHDDLRERAHYLKWYSDFFIPYLEIIDIRCISWETVIDTINNPDIRNFYSRCLKFNIPKRA